MNNTQNGSVIADTPEKIEAFRLLALKGALKLETKGLQMSRGRKASVMVRDYLKSKGQKTPSNKIELLGLFEQYLHANGILYHNPTL